MKRFTALFLVLILAFTCSIFAYAEGTESNELDNNNPDNSVLVDPDISSPDGLEGETEPEQTGDGDNGGTDTGTGTDTNEPVETPETENNGSSSSSGDDTPPDTNTEPESNTEQNSGSTNVNIELPDPLVVDLSEESISAVANAVSNSSASVTNKFGITYDVPSFVVDNDMLSHEYFFYGSLSSTSEYNQIFVASDEPLFVGEDNIVYGKYGQEIYICYSSGEDWQYLEYTNLNNGSDWKQVNTGGILAYCKRFYYSNHDIVHYSNYSVIYTSDVSSNSGSSYTYAYQYEFTDNNGSTYVIDTDVPNLFDDYTLIFGNLSGKTQLFVDVQRFQLNSSSSNYYYVCSLRVQPEGNLFVFETFETKAYQGTADCFIYWSNKHIYDYKTNDLIFESTYEPPVYYTVSFVSGIDGVEFDCVQVRANDLYTPPSFYADGYDFIGAYHDEDFNNLFVAGSKVTGDLTLYLRFDPVEYDYGTQLKELTDCLGIVQSQLWIILVVGLLGYVYKLFRMFF